MDYDPIESLENCVAFCSRDWSIGYRDAWIYGIVCGWEDAIGEVASQHGWDDDTINRLKILNEKFKKLRHIKEQ